MAKKKRKQRGDNMQDVTQKPLNGEAEEAVKTMEAVSRDRNGRRGRA